MTVVASLAFALGGEAAWAGGSTYYVSPNGSGAMCTDVDPCPLNASTSNPGPGNELVVLPGDYMVGDAPLNSLNTSNVHGVAGQPRPRIFSTGFIGWTLGSGGMTPPVITFSHLEIHTTGSVGLAVSGTGTTTVEDVVATATGAPGAGCAPTGGAGAVITIKNSLCRGANRGVGSSCAGCVSNNITLRNVTAIGDLYGIAFEATVGGSTSDFTVNAFNTIARHTGMAGADVRAQAGSTSSDVSITLAYSNYASEEQALCMTPPCTATVTDPGTGTGNQTAAPSFVDAVAGDFHQLPTSPTVGAGVNDMNNGMFDVDGQQRQIDTVDIGADELGRPTATSLGCAPSSVLPGTAVTCTATVSDTGAGSPSPPTGPVAFSSAGAGSFASATCNLAPAAAAQSSCTATYTPQAGTHQITAASSRDLMHEGSQGSAAITAVPVTPPKKKKCKRKKKRRPAAAAAKKKCKKRR